MLNCLDLRAAMLTHDKCFKLIKKLYWGKRNMLMPDLVFTKSQFRFWVNLDSFCQEPDSASF